MVEPLAGFRRFRQDVFTLCASNEIEAKVLKSEYMDGMDFWGTFKRFDVTIDSVGEFTESRYTAGLLCSKASAARTRDLRRS